MEIYKKLYKITKSISALKITFWGRMGIVFVVYVCVIVKATKFYASQSPWSTKTSTHRGITL